MVRKSFREGFTLIELTLSMVFIGILSLAVVLMINNTVVSYRRGMILSQINTTGMDLVDEMRSSVLNSTNGSVSTLCAVYYSGEERALCESEGGYNFVAVTRYADVMSGGEKIEDVPVFGAFCTGTYSYIWNSGYFWNDADGRQEVLDGVVPAVLRYRNASGDKAEVGSAENPFKLLKVRDDGRSICVSTVRGYSDGVYGDRYELSEPISNVFNVQEGYGLVTEEPTELMPRDENNGLVLYDLAVAEPAESTTQRNVFYSVSFILGTIEGGINVKASGKSCQTPLDEEAEAFDYCAINKFKFAVQAGGE